MFEALSEEMRTHMQHPHTLEEEMGGSQRVCVSSPALLCAHRLCPSLGHAVTLPLAFALCSSQACEKPAQGRALEEEQLAFHCRNILEKYHNAKSE